MFNFDSQKDIAVISSLQFLQRINCLQQTSEQANEPIHLDESFDHFKFEIDNLPEFLEFGPIAVVRTLCNVPLKFSPYGTYSNIS